MAKKERRGFESDRAEQSEVKTSQCDVFRESVDEPLPSLSAVSSLARGLLELFSDWVLLFELDCGTMFLALKSVDPEMGFVPSGKISVLLFVSI